jgi:hypothetical protein
MPVRANLTKAGYLMILAGSRGGATAIMLSISFQLVMGVLLHLPSLLSYNLGKNLYSSI